MSTAIQTALAGIERINQWYLTRRVKITYLSLLNQELTEIALPRTSGTMLDFGCGGQPCHELVGSRITKYIGADVAAAQGGTSDLQLIPGARVPMEDATSIPSCPYRRLSMFATSSYILKSVKGCCARRGIDSHRAKAMAPSRSPV